jgi:glutamyl-tRNA reductase
MPLLCVGLSHRTAPVELRERLYYPPDTLRAALTQVEGHRYGLQELAILSTCHRMEVYAVAGGEARQALTDLIAETTGTARAVFEPHLYWHLDSEAAVHLGHVAAGLDSLILGEPQILGQVVGAYEAARGQGAAGPALSGLFRMAIRAGKRARTETAISRNPATLSSVAVKLAEAVAGELAAMRVLVVGAGEMAELAAAALRQRGAGSLTVVGRTLDRAEHLARRWGARALTYEHLAQAVAEADVAIVSTSAPHVLIHLDLVRAALRTRPERPLLFVDLAVPRNVDPEVAGLPQVYYYDVDDLQAHLDDALAERRKEIPRVEAIVAEEAAGFMYWLRGLEITPLIASLRAKAEAIRRAEVEKTLGYLPHLSEAERQRIQALTEALVNKLLHDPTLRLKAEAGNGDGAEYAAAIRHLFALDD